MIYMITNTINGKKYIGKTAKSLKSRFDQHRYKSRMGADTYLYRAMRKYGEHNFTIALLCDGDSDEEIAMIEKHNPEYNMTKGGDGGDTSNSPSYRKKLLERDNKGCRNPMWGRFGINNPNYGKKRTDEQKDRSRKSYKGKRIPVIVHGVHYESVAFAAKTLKRSERYVRLHDELNEWNY